MAGRRARGVRVACTALLLPAGAMVCASDAGPPARRALPDSLTTAWTATAFNWDGETADPSYLGEFDSPQAAFSPRAAVLPNLGRIEIRDPETGRMLHDIDVGERVGEVAIADGVVVAQTAPARGDLAYGMLRGYDVSSGRRLWAQSIGVGHVVQTGRYSYAWDDGAAVVTTHGIVTVGRGGELSGQDLKTGRRRWTRGRICARAGTVSATATTAVLLCDNGRPALVDPRTGKSRHADVPGQAAGLSTTADAIGISSGFPDDQEGPDTLTVVAGSGRRLGRIDDASSLVAMDGDQAVAYRYGELRAVSLAHGTELWRRKTESEVAGGYPRGTYDGVSAGDGLVLVSRAPERGRPGATTVTDLSGRTTPPLPWPVSGKFAGAVPGLVFVVSHAGHQYQFTALRLDDKGLSAPRLGGADPADWPDPCRLLTPQQLATLGRGYTGFPASPSPFAARIRLPRTDQCDFAGRHPFSLQVGWVAADDRAAALLAQSLLPSPDRLWQAGPDGYQFNSVSANAPAVADRAVVVRGRFVINVFAPRQVALTTKIARILQGPAPDAPGSRDRAIAEKIVEDHGFTAAIQLWPPLPGPLRAVYASCGGECHQVFLFYRGVLVGAPPGESATRPTYRQVQVARQDGRTVQLAVGVFAPSGPQVVTEIARMDLQMSGDRLVYRVDHGPWQAAPAAPVRGS